MLILTSIVICNILLIINPYITVPSMINLSCDSYNQVSQFGEVGEVSDVGEDGEVGEVGEVCQQGCTKFILAGNQPYSNLNWLRDFMHSL